MNSKKLFYKLFDIAERRAKDSYKPKQTHKDTRTARSSSLYNAMKVVKSTM